MRLLLDSSACIAVMRDRPKGSRRLSESWSRSETALSSVVLAELEVGAHLSKHPQQTREALDSLLENLTILPFDRAAAEVYGFLRASLQSAGRQIGPLDMLIAAHALSLDLPLLTGNVSEFGRVPGLRVLGLDDA
ncbi:type II toxin-antitoxin system VapC family toxin [Nevskia sp.]|uniref:type II toxin-antitoxin system VapC family toxin n=1 Tax=Nevskia sp. TaxID=1929292 RepID=UPI0025D94C6C|nr:type II toxin-antitoxin system VapC family toxin [Nevskia sp.]